MEPMHKPSHHPRCLDDSAESDPAEPDKGVLDHVVTFVQFISACTYSTAFIILLTGAMLGLHNNTGAENIQGYTPGFWLVLSLTAFLIYFLTKEYEGERYGEVAQKEAEIEREEVRRSRRRAPYGQDRPAPGYAPVWQVYEP